MSTPNTKTGRQQIKSRFVRNAIPTEKDFDDLIEAGLNQADDGLFKLPNEPLSLNPLRQTPDQAVLLFYDGPDAKAVAWQIQLSADSKPGFALANEKGVNFIIDSSNGNVGIGTTSAAAKLHVFEEVGTGASPSAGSLLLDHEDPGGKSSIVFRAKYRRETDCAYIEYNECNAELNKSWWTDPGLLTIGIQDDINSDSVAHISLMPSELKTQFDAMQFGCVGIGTKSPAAKLHIFENSSGSDVGHRQATLLIEHGKPGGKSSIVFPSSVDKDYAYIQYSDKSPGSSDGAGTLTIGKARDSSAGAVINGGDILFLTSGNVGVGIIKPSAKLHVRLVDSPPNQDGFRIDFLNGSWIFKADGSFVKQNSSGFILWNSASLGRFGTGWQ